MKKTDLQKIEDIVLDLENEAENGNYHDLCVVYRSLAELLIEVLDDTSALKVMKEIQKRGGFLP